VEGIGEKKLREIEETVSKITAIEPVMDMFGHILSYRDMIKLVSGKKRV
jgi:hypothetical protein